MRPVQGGYAGPAADRLGAFEEFCLELEDQQREYAAQLEALRRENRTKSVKFRELMGKKLLNSQFLTQLRVRGLVE